MLEATASNSASPGTFSLYSDDISDPGTTNLAYDVTHSSSGFVISALGADGGIDITNSYGSPDLSLTVEGYFTAAAGSPDAGGYVPLSPLRIFDTDTTPIQPGTAVQLQVSGSYGVPGSANAIFASITASSDSGGSGGVAIWPDDQTEPAVSTMRWNDATLSSGASLGLGSHGLLNIANTGSEPINVSVDLEGYFASGSSSGGGGFSPTVALLYDSAADDGQSLDAGGTITVSVSGGPNDLPPPQLLSAVALSVSVSSASAPGSLFIYPSDSTQPSVPALSFAAGEEAGSLVVSPAGGDGSVTIYNSSASPVNITVSIEGTFGAQPVQSCDDADKTEYGLCATEEAADALTDTQQQQLSGKLAAYDSVYDQLVAQEQAEIQQPPEGGAYKIPAVVNMTIFKEGEGDGGAYWTCGPAATRNMVYAMRGYSAGEATWVSREGTTRDGTSPANIKVALNKWEKPYGVWDTYKPPNRDRYLAIVSVDTYGDRQAVIANVDTSHLTFWNGHETEHFYFDYGFDTKDPNARTIAIGEEWDPNYLFGAGYGASHYGDPYGHHPQEPLINAFEAENQTSYHKLVA